MEGAVEKWEVEGGGCADENQADRCRRSHLLILHGQVSYESPHRMLLRQFLIVRRITCSRFMGECDSLYEWITYHYVVFWVSLSPFLDFATLRFGIQLEYNKRS